MIEIKVTVGADATELRDAADTLLQIAEAVGAVIPHTIELPLDVDLSQSAGTIEPTVETDSAGLPWDSRIHSAAKTKVKSTGNWKKKRGVSDDLVLEVEMELEKLMAIDVVPVSKPEPVTAPPPPAPEPDPVSETVTYVLPDGKKFTGDQLLEAGWDINSIKLLPIAVPAADPFPEFMQRVTAALASGELHNDNVAAATARVGLASLPLLSARPDLIPAVQAELFGD